MSPGRIRLLLRLYSRRAPFVPFFVELTSGGLERVEHPEAMTLERTDGGLFITHRLATGAYSIFECDAVVRFLDIDGYRPPPVQETRP